MRIDRLVTYCAAALIISFGAAAAMAQTATKRYLFVPIFSSSVVTVFDLETLQLVKHIPMTVKGACCAYPTPDGSKVFITAGLSPYVVTIDTRSLSVLRTTKLQDRWGDRGSPVQRDGKLYWTSGIFAGHVEAIDVETGKVMHTYRDIGNVFTVTHDGRTIYTVKPYGDEGSVFNGKPSKLKLTSFEAATGKVIATADLPPTYGGPIVAIPTFDDRKLYLPMLGQASLMQVIDVSDRTHPRYLRSIQTGSASWVGGFNEDGTQLWIPNSGDGTISIIDVKTDALIHTIEVGQYVGNLVLSGDRAYVAVSPLPHPPSPGKNTIATIVGIIPGAALTPPDKGSTKYRPGIDIPGEIHIYDTKSYLKLDLPALPLPSITFGMAVATVPTN
jgi:YVTN family beta-propeller protein